MNYQALRDSIRKWRARKEARALVRGARRGARTYGYRLSKPVVAEINDAAEVLETARLSGDHDEICGALAKLEHLTDRHLSFARKSTLLEYVWSIAVAIGIALVLRAFVVEAFKIPSGSMIPTMEVGDHIFVNKFIYGLRVPFTRIKFFEWRKPRRGEVIVFIYPQDPGKDFIKRIVGIEGDRLEVRQDVLFVNGEPVPHEREPGL